MSADRASLSGVYVRRVLRIQFPNLLRHIALAVVGEEIGDGFMIPAACVADQLRLESIADVLSPDPSCPVHFFPKIRVALVPAVIGGPGDPGLLACHADDMVLPELPKEY